MGGVDSGIHVTPLRLAYPVAHCMHRAEGLLHDELVPAYYLLSVLPTSATVIKHSFGSRFLWLSWSVLSLVFYGERETKMSWRGLLTVWGSR